MLDNKAQELYDNLWVEVVDRYEARGLPPPDESKIFQSIVKAVRESVIEGDPTAPEFLEQLREVVPVYTRAKVAPIKKPEKNVQ